MRNTEIMDALSVARETAREASQLALRGWRAGGEVGHKGAIDLITEYDVQNEVLIRERLSAAFPSHRIVGEEQDESGAGEVVWYVDPIDGTTNFAHGHPFFCVSLALYEADDPLVGVVSAPALGLEWYGSVGNGAFRNGARCRVSSRESLAEALCATGFPYDRWSNPNNNVAEFSTFLQATRGIRRCGSAAIDLAMVADGTFDIYWERGLNAWDMCAGALLVREAGGTLSTYEGLAPDPRSGELVATNGRLHGDAISVIGQARDARASKP